MRGTYTRIAALFLAFALALSCAACGESNKAASMWLVKTEGDVSVADGQGKSISAEGRLGLFSGYSVATASSSYGWVSLDDTKFSKLDELSRAGVEKSGKSLELTVLEGSVYFNVTKPLEADETMTIRSANMVTAIRGTSGWVRVESEERMYVYILDGTVECSVTDPETGDTVTEKVTAGEYANMNYTGGAGYIDKGEFSAEDVPGFVRDETDEWEDLPTAESGEPTSPADGSVEWSDGNITVTLDQSVLTVSGTGAMTDYGWAWDQPWHDYAREIRKVVVRDGVTHIGNFAFSGLSIEEVELADSVTSIGNGAFSGTPSLKQITLPENLVSIGESAFTQCGLETLTVPENVTEIDGSAFVDCRSLASVEILGPVETLNCTFVNCVSLTDIRLPASLRRIGGETFRNTGIASMDIPDGVSAVGTRAFSQCPHLTEIYIPASVSELGVHLFESDKALTDIYFGGSAEQWEALISGSIAVDLPGNVTMHFGAER